MIIGQIDQADRLEACGGLIAKAAQWLSANYNNILTDFVPGTAVEVCPGVTVKYIECELAAPADQKSEFHNRHIDIHVPITGPEVIGWSPLTDMTEPATSYNETKDTGFFAQPTRTLQTVMPGEYLLTYPEDVHAPGLASTADSAGSPLRKLCIKIDC